MQDQYLYGADMLVTPVIEEGAIERRVVLPGDAPWRHVWSGEDFVPGEHIVAAPATARPYSTAPQAADDMTTHLVNPPRELP